MFSVTARRYVFFFFNVAVVIVCLCVCAYLTGFFLLFPFCLFLLFPFFKHDYHSRGTPHYHDGNYHCTAPVHDYYQQQQHRRRPEEEEDALWTEQSVRIG